MLLPRLEPRPPHRLCAWMNDRRREPPGRRQYVHDSLEGGDVMRILLVEDEPALAAGVRDDLQAEGYTVDLAVDGQAAASQGAQGQYDLILLDVMLPKKDGFAVCRELRAGNIH